MKKYWKFLAGFFLIVVPSFCIGQEQPPPVEPNITVSANVPDTEATFIGYASPNAFITFYDGGAVVGTVSANSSGGFSKTLFHQTADIHSFNITSEDVYGRTAPTYSFVVTLIPQHNTIISNIVLPTTIALSATEINQGEAINILGSTTPGANVALFVHSETINKNFSAPASGHWNYRLQENLTPGNHSTYARVSVGNLLSSNSQSLSFSVLEKECGNADLNRDGRVNLTDFSILLFHWGTGNEIADINCDGIINLTDFSIMLFRWTG